MAVSNMFSKLASRGIDGILPCTTFANMMKAAGSSSSDISTFLSARRAWLSLKTGLSMASNTGDARDMCFEDTSNFVEKAVDWEPLEADFFSVAERISTRSPSGWKVCSLDILIFESEH